MWKADLGNGRYRNPILYVDYSDPDAIRVGEDYYMVASSFSNAPGLPLLHSKDLVNWELVNYCVERVPEFRYRNPIHGCGVWAPSIRFHEGMFYVCFPMPDEGIYMTTATDPLGKWSEPVNIRPGAGWIDPCPFWDDDGRAYLVAGVAKSRIGYKSVLHMVEMRPDGMGLIGDEVKIFDGNENDQITIEGPKMYKRNGWYYIFAPAGGVKTGWQTVLRSRSPFGKYEYRVVMRQGSSPVNGPHQGAWVDTVTGQDWFLHFQDVYAAGRITHLQPMRWVDDWPIIGLNFLSEPKASLENSCSGERSESRTSLDRNEPRKHVFCRAEREQNLNFMDEPKASLENSCSGERSESRTSLLSGIPVMEYDKPDVGKKWEIKNQNLSDFFNSDKLSLQWQWNANPDAEWYSLTGNGLRINAVSASNARPLGDTRNILLQKWQEPEFSCVTKLNISDMKNGDMAGYISLGIDYCAVTFEKYEDGIKVYHVTGTQHFDCDTPYTTEKRNFLGEPETDLENDRNIIYVKYSVRTVGTRDCIEGGITVKDVPVSEVEISISYGGKNFTNPITMEAKAGRWVGVKHGFFLRHDDSVKTAAGSILVESVVFKGE